MSKLNKIMSDFSILLPTTKSSSPLTLKQRLNIHFLCYALNLTGAKIVKMLRFVVRDTKKIPGILRHPVSSFLGIVMLMMVLEIGAVYQRLTSSPECPCVLSCSAVFLELYFMFSVSYQFQNVCLHECINKH